MANLGDLKQRIITETTRDDLVDDLAPSLNLIIAKCIDQYAATRFWFNEQRASNYMTAGQQFQPFPPGFRFVDQLNIVIGGMTWELRKRSYTDLESLYAIPQQGQPTDWAYFNDQCWVWPAPTSGFQLIVLGVADVLPPLDYNDDTSANHWTNAGQDLITAASKKRLYRDYLSAMETDPRLQLAGAQEKEAYERLQAESNRRLATGQVRPGW